MRRGSGQRGAGEGIGVGSILFRRETGVYEMVANDEDGVLHQLALFRVVGPVFRADGSLGRLPWPREAMEADLDRGRWQRAGRVEPGGAVAGATVRISWRFYLMRMARWPYSQFVEPHRNGQYRAVGGLWRAGRRAAALRWLIRSAAVTAVVGLLSAPLFLLGQAVALAVAVVRTAGGRRV